MNDSLAAASRLRDMTALDLPLVLAWRNHPDVRRWMLSRQLITPDEHQRWFEHCLETGTKRLLIFERAGTPSGFLSLTRPEAGGISEWGFYTAPGAPAGTGTALAMAAIEYAFRALLLHKLVGRTLGENHRSIHCHLKWGFHREGTLRAEHFDGERYHDVVCFGLLREEWERRAHD